MERRKREWELQIWLRALFCVRVWFAISRGICWTLRVFVYCTVAMCRCSFSLVRIRGQRCIDSCGSVRRNIRQVLPTTLTHHISTDKYTLEFEYGPYVQHSETEIYLINKIFQSKVNSAPLAPAIRKILNLRILYTQAFNLSEQWRLYLGTSSINTAREDFIYKFWIDSMQAVSTTPATRQCTACDNKESNSKK